MRLPAASPSTLLRRDAVDAIPAGDDAASQLQSALNALLPARPRLRVLDAGCGGKMKVALPKEIELIGIDISPESMGRNTNLDRAIVGDIQTYDFCGETFDVILCWNVLEHVPDPLRAVGNLLSALAEDGIAILALPNVLSVKALVTKATPHALHTLFVRHVLGNPNAGKPGHGPFPLHLPFSLAPERLKAAVQALGYEVAYLQAYEGPQVQRLRRRSPVGYALYRTACAAAAAGSLGRLPARLSDTHMIVKRR